MLMANRSEPASPKPVNFQGPLRETAGEHQLLPSAAEDHQVVVGYSRAVAASKSSGEQVCTMFTDCQRFWKNGFNIVLSGVSIRTW
jgi:hypothetical protein